MSQIAEQTRPLSTVPRVRPTTDTVGRSEQEKRFVDLVHTHRAGLLAYTSRLTGGDTGRAEDIVQETFTRAWRRIDLLTPQHGSVGSWLRRVAANVAIDHHRMRQARPSEVELQHHDAPMRQDGTDGTDQILVGMVVHDMLSSIWPEHRAVLEEVYLKDRTAAEAAEVLGIPVGTVKSRLFYALRTLRGNALTNGLRAG
ncbi:sigma-70 family RNA polymerase sigma factor [Kineosporia succinea]|uniref:RNA polymerase sigma-70 factor (ECF subfamily) n=1 Tax=Kineosporia succinea TaxID=84632 RepID=A0ABT9P500_9ACTN|nr:sigma-70 family RNA polymerase sigma factor [Kineosporia succinea]MDP9827768.1 RNA polymerase sigma-70 factor (ECF subfamily) [Kineosporia succinea]